jgi:hypothetical protein
MQGKRAEERKKLADGVAKMYKFKSKQIGVTDFGMPLGMKLDPNNRWVKKAQIIPWDEIEVKYAELFKNRKGNVAKPLRLALGALLIQTERRISDEETAFQIQETPCLQYFCGFSEYKDEPPFDPSLMVYFRKRLTSEILGEINEIIITSNKSKPKSPPDDKGSSGRISEISQNGETLIIDATCAPQNVRYPQDTSILNEARENLEEMLDELHKSGNGIKPRTYRKRARKDYLEIAKRRKKSAKQIRKAIGKQLRYIKRDIEIVENYPQNGNELSKRKSERLKTIKIMYKQQQEMYENRTRQVENRIVSLSQPWVRPIVRGKAKAPCEFGAKLDISVSDGFARLEYTSFDANNESANLRNIVQRFYEREGHYPERVLVDKIYRTRENIGFCKERGIRLSGKPLGRPKKEAVCDKKQIRTDEIDRIEVERKFGEAKSRFGLGLIRTKLENTSKTAIALAIVALNIAHIGRIWRTLFRKLYFCVIAMFIFEFFCFVQ